MIGVEIANEHAHYDGNGSVDGHQAGGMLLHLRNDVFVQEVEVKLLFLREINHVNIGTAKEF